MYVNKTLRSAFTNLTFSTYWPNILFATKKNQSNRWLVRRGANVNAVSNWGQIPIHCAVESKVDDEDGVNVAYLVST